MKHILFITAAALMLLSSCQRAVPGLSVQSASETSLSASGGTVAINVKSDGEWKTSADKDIIVEPSSGSGNQSVRIKVPANTSASEKDMEVTFYSVLGDLSDIINVTQKSPSVSVDIHDFLKVSALGETIGVKVTSDGGWNSSAGEGIAVTPFYGSEKETDVRIAVPANTTSGERELKVKFCSALNSSIYDMVTIKQKSVNFSVEPSSAEVSPSGGICNFTVTTEGKWKTIADNGSTVEPGEGSGGASVKVKVLANATGTDRDVRVVFYSIENASLSDTVTIHQKTLSINVTPESDDVSALGGDVRFYVEANGRWTASAGNGITVTPSTFEGSDSVTVRVPKNETGHNRDVTVTFTLTGTQLSKTVTITQEPIKVKVEEVSIDDVSAAEDTVSVTLHSNCSWKSEIGGWIYSDGSKNVSDQIVSDPSSGGPGDYNVSITVPANRSKVARNVEIKFYYENNSAISDVVTIHQKAPSVTINPSSGVVSWKGGELYVNVTADGGWSAACDSTQVHIDTLNYDYSNEKEVTINVDASSDGAARDFIVRFKSKLNGDIYQDYTIHQNKKQ